MKKDSFTLQEIAFLVRYGYLDSLESLKQAKAFLEYDKDKVKDVRILPFVSKEGIGVDFCFCPLEREKGSLLDKFLGSDKKKISKVSYMLSQIPDDIYTSDGAKAHILDGNSFFSLANSVVSYPWFSDTYSFIDNEGRGSLEISPFEMHYENDDCSFSYSASSDSMYIDGHDNSVLQGLHEVFPSGFDRSLFSSAYQEFLDRDGFSKRVIITPELASYSRALVDIDEVKDSVVLRKVKS